MKLHWDDIDPDGVSLSVDWDLFVVGSSLFIPCINHKKAVRQVANATGLRSRDLTFIATIVDDKYGIRIWRVT
jgi:hypothetical protein